MDKKILAFSLGDGHLNKYGKLSLVHCSKQKEYLDWKESIIGSNDGITYFENNGYDAYRFYKSFKNEGKQVYKKLYGVMNKKYFSEEIVNNMDKFCWAVLYCDDGSLCRKKNKGKTHAYMLTISTYCSYNECERLQKNAKEIFGVDFIIKKDKGKYLLYCGTKQIRIFLPQIKEIVPNFKCFSESKFKKDELKNQF